MLEALSAEALKMRTHKATWFLVWLFPIAFTIIMLLMIGAGMLGFERPDQPNAHSWLENTTMIWFVPNNAVGRYLISAFVAVVFAGEYGWNTWKLIVPHRRRVSLIAAKYALTMILFAISFIVTALLLIGLAFADDALTGDTIPAAITAAVIWEEHSKAALAAVAPVLIAIAYSATAVMLNLFQHPVRAGTSSGDETGRPIDLRRVYMSFRDLWRIALLHISMSQGTKASAIIASRAAKAARPTGLR